MLHFITETVALKATKNRHVQLFEGLPGYSDRSVTEKKKTRFVFMVLKVWFSGQLPGGHSKSLIAGPRRCPKGGRSLATFGGGTVARNVRNSRCFPFIGVCRWTVPGRTQFLGECLIDLDPGKLFKDQSGPQRGSANLLDFSHNVRPFVPFCVELFGRVGVSQTFL